MLTFLRIETRGGNLVAVFDRGQGFIPTDAGHGYYDDGTFCLNEQSLRTRIANIGAGRANPNCDTSVERAALIELRQATTNQPEQGG